MKKNILFLCTGNSCRSQMAEGWGKNLKNNKFNFYSAGTKKSGLNPDAILVMKEVGVDISAQESKTIDELPNVKIDVVFTLCSDAHENCPYFNADKIIHKGFDDPPKLTAKITNQNEKLIVYRRVRDEIKTFVNQIERYLDEQ